MRLVALFLCQFIAILSLHAQCDRAQVMAEYTDQIVNTRTLNNEFGWTGDASTCTAGDVSALAREHALTRINYYRARVGLGPVAYDDALNAKAQQAALMMHAERSLNHFPDTSFACYSQEGREAAGKSNLALGAAGAHAVNAYMFDRGAGNIAVGHRRWIQYSRARTIGQGFTTTADAMWVIGNNGPSTFTGDFMAWPTPGINPSPITPQRWSFTIPGANFMQAEVAVRDVYGNALTVTQHPVQNGFGDNTLVWEMERSEIYVATPDVSYEVTVSNVVSGGETRSFTYEVTISNPVQEQDCGPGLAWDDNECACRQQASTVQDAQAFAKTFQGPVRVAVLDLSGRRVAAFTDQAQTVTDERSLMERLDAGLWIIQLEELSSGRLAHRKLHVSH